MVERYPNLKEEVDGNLAMWSTASCVLAMACQPYVKEKKLKN
jgi:hypothetical protein